MLRMEVLAIGVCCSAMFPRGSERCSGEDHGTSSVGRCGVGGYPREGDASCCHDTVRPACVGSFELDRETWRESIEILGFDRLLLLGLRSQLDWLRVAVESCKKTFVGMVCA
ncbi:hypothetical protein BHM03_00035791 [Ensete ventricosum]|nr:hypothetical protein BHM03_00035791 [Ensete ventricosum]